jgi:hypothetical protein
VVSIDFTAIGTSGYSGAQIAEENGVHTVSGSQPIQVNVYGFGWADDYIYFGGVVE